MKSHSIFNIRRFGLLLRHDLILNSKTYLLKITAFTLLAYFILLYFMFQNASSFQSSQYHGTSYQGYFLLFLVGLGVFIGTSFTEIGNKVKRTAYLQLPASTFEKFFHPFFLRIIVGSALFFLIFWVDARLARAMYLSATQFQQVFINGMLVKPDAFQFSFLFTQRDIQFWLPVTMTIVNIVLFLFGVPLFFKKQALVKTILTFFVLLFLVFISFVVFSRLFYPEARAFEVKLNDYFVWGTYKNVEVFFLTVMALACPSLLLASFYRLKETRI